MAHTPDYYLLTTVDAFALLLVVLGSASIALTLALLVSVPVVVGTRLILTVAMAPLANVPSAQLTVVVP